MALTLLLKRQIAFNLKGAWQLLQFNPLGMAQIDTSWRGARFSFIAALLSLPAYLLLQWVEGGASFAAKPLAIALIIYVFQWCTLPLIVYYLCQSWGRVAAYPRFIASLNWMTFCQSLIYAAVTLLFVGGLIPAAVGAPLSFLLLVYLFAVEGFIVQRSLGIGLMGAAGVVVLDIFIVWQLGIVRNYLLT